MPPQAPRSTGRVCARSSEYGTFIRKPLGAQDVPPQAPRLRRPLGARDVYAQAPRSTGRASADPSEQERGRARSRQRAPEKGLFVSDPPPPPLVPQAPPGLEKGPFVCENLPPARSPGPLVTRKVLLSAKTFPQYQFFRSQMVLGERKNSLWAEKNSFGERKISFWERKTSFWERKI